MSAWWWAVYLVVWVGVWWSDHRWGWINRFGCWLEDQFSPKP